MLTLLNEKDTHAAYLALRGRIEQLPGVSGRFYYNRVGYRLDRWIVSFSESSDLISIQADARSSSTVEFNFSPSGLSRFASDGAEQFLLRAPRAPGLSKDLILRTLSDFKVESINGSEWLAVSSLQGVDLLGRIAHFTDRWDAARRGGDMSDIPSDVPPPTSGYDNPGPANGGTRREVSWTSPHNEVFRIVASKLKEDGWLTSRGHQHADLFRERNGIRLLIEVKPSCDTYEIIVAIGQLVVYAQNTPACLKAIAAPGPLQVDDDIKSAMTALSIIFLNTREPSEWQLP